MKTPILETERLILRSFKPEDAEEVFNNWTSDADVAKFMRWSVHKSISDTFEWITSEFELIDSDTIYNWIFVLKETDELIGSGGLVYNREKQMFELGYNIMKKYWNQGLTTEASFKILEFAENEMSLPELFCCHAKDNIGSGKVIEKLGFKYTGDNVYYSWDKSKKFDCREYILCFNKGL